MLLHSTEVRQIFTYSVVMFWLSFFVFTADLKDLLICHHPCTVIEMLSKDLLWD